MQGFIRKQKGAKFGDGSEIYLDEKVLLAPLKWRKPRRVFVCSMSDLFWSKVPHEWIERIFGVMINSSQHVWQVLTKRPQRMLEFLAESGAGDYMPASPGHCSVPNYIWLGVSAEDQKRWDERVPILCRIPAAVRFVSVEPMLGPVDINHACAICGGNAYTCPGDCWEYHTAEGPELIEPGVLSWIICGGESGPKARPMHPEWARSLRDQCVAAGVPFFFKQWGEWLPSDHNTRGYQGCYPLPGGFRWGVIGKGRAEVQVLKVGKKRAGRTLDGRTWDEMPEPLQPS